MVFIGSGCGEGDVGCGVLLRGIDVVVRGVWWNLCEVNVLVSMDEDQWRLYRSIFDDFGLRNRWMILTYSQGLDVLDDGL
jgi:hypothetical protein